ncbi:hypothetical protein BCR44DRAFT_1482391 [Catenaria anguillulae PL171]|uniref:Uncharacterized protein n=1 Tax=Catenaria anguillulae PL171 TaxID=765915 RepID=A0A1Y2I0I0_9FUNG|nr:hypothetical protein BCR44DRAFT_1482391 [Catenaria anguillulae PL171]
MKASMANSSTNLNWRNRSNSSAKHESELKASSGQQQHESELEEWSNSSAKHESELKASSGQQQHESELEEQLQMANSSTSMRARNEGHELTSYGCDIPPASMCIYVYLLSSSFFHMLNIILTHVIMFRLYKIDQHGDQRDAFDHDAQQTALTSSLPDQTAAMPSSDGSVGYNLTAQELHANTADEAKEDTEHDKTGSSRATRRVMDPRSVSAAQVHEFHRRSLLPMDDLDWCDPTGGILPLQGDD